MLGVLSSCADMLPSRSNELDINVRRASEWRETPWIRGDDPIAVVGEQDERRIDYVVLSRSGQQLSCRSTKDRIKATDIQDVESPCKQCLPRTATAPRLSNNSGVAHRRLALLQREL